ncbi:MAG: protein kinase [Planctomycetota bacterium]
MSRDLERRNRALAELARARDWVSDADLERAHAEAGASGEELGERLGRAGLLTPEQVSSLREAVDGTMVTRRTASDATITASGPGPLPIPTSTPQQVGPYRILRELGRGGMGVVYRALHPELRREVALKVLLHAGQADDDTLERFRREASLVAKIGRHPHLVQVHDVGREDDRLYFTMDFVEGRSLRQRIETEGALPPREAASIAADMAGALEAAHRAGVVHRDVKPHNVLIDAAGAAFLSDFGLAKDLASSQGLTATGEVFGTPAYMSPEQAAGRARHATPASDVYSLGATLYEMLTGHVAFAGQTAVEMMRLTVSADPAPPRSLRPDIHPDLEIICLHAMRKEPERRYASAAAFEADLRHFLAGEPILARPAGAWEKLLSRARRRRGVVAAAGVALLAAMGAMAWAGTKFVKKREEESARAEMARQRRGTEEAARGPAEKGRSLVELAVQAERTGDRANQRRFADEAAKHLMEAALLIPDDADLRYDLGRAFRFADKPDTAMRELEAAVRLKPAHALAWFEHGLLAVERLLLARGRLRRGIAVQRSYNLESSGAAVAGVTVAHIGGGSDDPEALSMAVRDFQNVLELNVAGERAAFGRGMLHYLEKRYEDARRELDSAILANPYFVEAVRARADLTEVAGEGIAAAVDDRRRAHELCPGNNLYTYEFAFCLALSGRKEDALLLLPEVTARDPNSASYDQAANLAEICWAREMALDYRRLAVESARGEVNIDLAAQRYFMHLVREQVPGARQKFLDECGARLSPGMLTCIEAQGKARAFDWNGAARLFRKLPDDSPYLAAAAEVGANAEWLCGNLDRGAMMADLVIANRVVLDAEHYRAQVRLDRGDVAGGLADYEAIRLRAPGYNQNLVHLAGARLLAGDATGSADALVEAIGTTPLAAEHRAAALKFMDAMKERAKTADTPEKRRGLVESVLVSLSVIQGFAPDSPRVQDSIGIAQRGLWYLLQRLYLEAEHFDKSVAAGDAFMKFYRAGAVLFRQSAARALQKKPKSALKLLQEALEAGFDDGSRLDADKAFDSLRETPEFRELRAKCR